MDASLLIAHTEASLNLARSDGAHKIIQPEEVPFISYPVRGPSASGGSPFGDFQQCPTEQDNRLSGETMQVADYRVRSQKRSEGPEATFHAGKYLSQLHSARV